MESYFLEVQKFGYRALIVEISVIQRDDGIGHRILEISQIEFYDFIDENIGIGETRKIILPKRCFLDPIDERNMEFLDGLLISTQCICFFQFFHQNLGFFHISEISEET